MASVPPDQLEMGFQSNERASELFSRATSQLSLAASLAPSPLQKATFAPLGSPFRSSTKWSAKLSATTAASSRTDWNSGVPITMRVSSQELNDPAEKAPLCLWAEPRSAAMALSMRPPSREKAPAIFDHVPNSCSSVGGAASGAALLHAALALSRHSTNSGLAAGS